MPLNTRYLRTSLGKLKLISAVLGFITEGLFIHGETAADWISHPSREKACKEDVEAVNLLNFETKPCPESWLIHTATWLTSICLATSLIVLIMLIFVALNNNSWFNQIDFIGHLVAGVCLLFAAIFAFTFIRLAVSYTEAYFCPLRNENCRKYFDDLFHPWTFGIAGLFALVNGCVYMNTALFIKRGRKVPPSHTQSNSCLWL